MPSQVGFEYKIKKFGMYSVTHYDYDEVGTALSNLDLEGWEIVDSELYDDKWIMLLRRAKDAT